MPKKPVHLAAAGKLTPRERVWQHIRKLREFTLDALHRDLCKAGFDKLEMQLLYDYAEELRESAYLQSAGGAFTLPRGKGKSQCGRTYKLVRDIGAIAPQLKPVTGQGAMQLQLWRGMRILKEFTETDLVAGAGTGEVPVSVPGARRYLSFLVKAGYLVAARRHGGTRQTRYSFVPKMDSGPKAPQIQRVMSVYDPNTGKVMWQQETEA